MKLHTVVAASAALLLSATAAQAKQVAALVGDDTIAMVDTAAGKVTKSWAISGIDGRVAGIDVRPANGMLYALAENGDVYTVDTATGKATKTATLATMLPAGVTASVDFNPAADRLRVMGSDGTNLRANVDDGKVVEDGTLRYADGDTNKGKMPKVVAAAYTNSVKGTKSTALFDIGSGALLSQAPPNDGVLNTVGMLGVTGDVLAFDIRSDGKGGNEAWLMAPSGLHSVDLATGKAGPAITIEGVTAPVRDIAILPSM